MPRDRSSTRLDRALVARGLVASRTRAQQLVRRGRVSVRGSVETRPSVLVEPSDVIEVAGDLPFVSRGGEKLAAALAALDVLAEGRDCLDVGASTGGFTHCLLERGASRVCAVDVGHDQLAPRLRADPRVVVMEATDVRDLDAADLPFVPSLTVVDASFISLGAIAPSLARLAPPGGEVVALVKPQFEVGRELARRFEGVVPMGPERSAAIDRAAAALRAEGFDVTGGVDSALEGPKGNVEHFLRARRVG